MAGAGKMNIKAGGNASRSQYKGPPPGRTSSPNIPKPTAGAKKLSASSKRVKG